MSPSVRNAACTENEFLVHRWHKIANSRSSADLGAYFTAEYGVHVVGNRRTDLADLQRPERAFPLSFSDISHAIHYKWPSTRESFRVSK
jgi:hypothetical protein